MLVSPTRNDILILILFYLSLTRICTMIKSVQWYEKNLEKIILIRVQC